MSARHRIRGSRLTRRLAAGVALLALAAALPAAAAAPRVKEIFGWVEWVAFELPEVEGELDLKAKLDTGAETSSLDATHIRRFRRGGEPWVEFTLTDPASGEEHVLKRPRLRRVRIKRHEGVSQERSVVALRVCLGEYEAEVQFSLIDRSEFIYPVLLGRRFLEGKALVDPEDTFTRDPTCYREDG